MRTKLLLFFQLLSITIFLQAQNKDSIIKPKCKLDGQQSGVNNKNTSSELPIPTDSLYLGKTDPGNTPQIFIQNGAERIAISKDGKEIYYSTITAENKIVVNCLKYQDNKWNKPDTNFKNFYGPTFSTNQDTIFTHGDGTATTYSASRNSLGWNSPTFYANGLYYFQVTDRGNYYVGSNTGKSIIGNYDLCKLTMNKTDTLIQSLGFPLNTTNNDAEFFIAKDESFIVLGANEGGPGGRDLYISYRKTDNTWTNPKSLGVLINDGDYYKWGPLVSADNKYLFYTKLKTNATVSTASIYWVRFDILLEGLKKTNFAPYVKNKIMAQTDTVGQSFNYTLPDSTFFDDDGNITLTYSATLSNNNPLPSWLSFDPATRTFSGTPTKTGAISIKVIATDNAKASVAALFYLKVVDNQSPVEKIAICNKASNAIKIDGLLNDVDWTLATKYNIDTPFFGEDILGGTSDCSGYFQTVWADSGIYVAVSVTDDIKGINTNPASFGPAWAQDLVEIYFDMNTGNLKDNLGTKDNHGHYQNDGYASDSIYNANGSMWVYKHTNKAGSYVKEVFIPWKNLRDSAGKYFSNNTLPIGFDVYISDNDANTIDAPTNYRNRLVWSNQGINIENYSNMDDAGKLIINGIPNIPSGNK